MPEMPLLSVYPDPFGQLRKSFYPKTECPSAGYGLPYTKSTSYLNPLYARHNQTSLSWKPLVLLQSHESDTAAIILIVSHLHLIPYISQSSHALPGCAVHSLRTQYNQIPDYYPDPAIHWWIFHLIPCRLLQKNTLYLRHCWLQTSVPQRKFQ